VGIAIVTRCLNKLSNILENSRREALRNEVSAPVGSFGTRCAGTCFNPIFKMSEERIWECSEKEEKRKNPRQQLSRLHARLSHSKRYGMELSIRMWISSTTIVFGKMLIRPPRTTKNTNLRALTDDEKRRNERGLWLFEQVLWFEVEIIELRVFALSWYQFSCFTWDHRERRERSKTNFVGC
jgi:hypothetical protein